MKQFVFNFVTGSSLKIDATDTPDGTSMSAYQSSHGHFGPQNHVSVSLSNRSIADLLNVICTDEQLEKLYELTDEA